MTNPLNDIETQYRQAMWHLCISRGAALGIQPDRNDYHTRAMTVEEFRGGGDRREAGPEMIYYHGDYLMDEAATLEVLEKFGAGIGIDYVASSDPGSYSEGYFNGTFAEDRAMLDILAGVLVLTDGSMYPWGAYAPSIDGYGFAATIKALSAAPSFEAAVASLTEMATSPNEYRLDFSSVVHYAAERAS